MASVLLLGLSACNNQEAALNPRNNDNITNVVNRDNNRNHLFNVNNNPNLDGDHRGPLTENDTDDFTKDYTNDWNNNPNKNGAPIISNFSTPMSSNEYPHTKSVQTQDARYQFLPVDPRQDTSASITVSTKIDTRAVPAPEHNSNNLIRLQLNSKTTNSSSY